MTASEHIQRSSGGASVQGGSGKLRIRWWMVIAAALLLAAAAIGLWIHTHPPGVTRISAVTLPCHSDEDVTIFGSDVLYYDKRNGVLYCTSSSGSVRWNYTLGQGQQFSVSDTYVVAWSDSEINVLDRGGRSIYKSTFSEPVQFARVGEKYFAAVTGSPASPSLIVRDMDGTYVDNETDNYKNMMLMDVGFYGDADQYMWSLALDIYSTAVNTVLNTFQVGKMNTGEVNLGEFIAYRVLYDAGRLRVFTTQQMYSYDYKAVQDLNGTQLVYGWELVDWDQPERGSTNMLLATASELNNTKGLTELRVLSGGRDSRFHLPSACIGAGIRNGRIYAVSKDQVLYVSPVNQSRFAAYQLPFATDAAAVHWFGLTDDGHAVFAIGDIVYAVNLPR